ncbi:MAG: JAB domain-containing protein [Gracilimonas sp.]|uniref:JAB domain-containing protein n=1 Tax=Gracilimonas sp. TaxID=1974203 RepID=UPI001998BE42|nr:JAB domain-containing protein [Gracilimonas sp.]MBD3615359.1 JAB domain-containing protein [Gracilimonas sp.]
MNKLKNITLSDSVPYCSISYSKDPVIENMPTISSSEEAYEFLMGVWDHGSISYKEEFAVVLLDNAKKVLGWAKISSGGATATIVDPAMVYQVALLSHAHSILLAHNHPSGILRASTADIHLTKRLKKAGRLLGIQVVDHLIISTSGYTSFMDKGLL